MCRKHVRARGACGIAAFIVLAIAAGAAPAAAHAQSAARLTPPVRVDPVPYRMDHEAPRVWLEEIRALRLSDRPEDALALAERAVSGPLAEPIRPLLREVRALESPAADRTWIHAAAVALPLGGAGALGTGLSWLLTGFGGWDQHDEIGLWTAGVLSGALLVAGVTLLFVHLGENTCDGDYRAFEGRRRGVELALRAAHRRAH